MMSHLVSSLKSYLGLCTPAVLPLPMKMKAPGRASSRGLTGIVMQKPGADVFPMYFVGIYRKQK